MFVDDETVVETMLLLDVVWFPLEDALVDAVDIGAVVVVALDLTSHPYLRFTRKMSFSVK